MKNFYLILFFALSFPALKAATCTWNGSTGNWSDPTKWSCGAVPGTGDDVVITSGTVTLNVSPSINNLTQSGGIINGNGNLTVGGTYNWSSGTLGASGATGTVTVAGLTTISVTGGLYGKTLQCNGGTTFSAGSFVLQGILNVPAGQTFLITAPGTISGIASSSILNISGTLHKQGPGAFDVSLCKLLNTSTFDIDQGSLEIGAPGGTHTGTFNLGAGAQLLFGQTGTNNFNGATFNAGAGASINVGASTLNFNAGTTMSPSMNLQNYVSYTINDNAGLSWNNVTLAGGSYTANSTTSIAGDLTMNGGVVIKGSGNVSVGGNLLQNAGDIEGTVSMTVAGSHNWKAGFLGYGAASTGTITVSGPTTLTTSAAHNLRAKTLNCNGGLEFAGGTFPIENGGTVNVPAGQTFLLSLSGGSLITNTSGTINLGGNLVKTGGGTFLDYYGILSNNTNFTISNGTLQFIGGSTHTGTFDLAAGTTLDFTSGTHNLNAVTIVGDGNLGFNASGSLTVNFNAGTTITPVKNLSQAGGTINDNVGLDWNNFTMTGGTYNSNLNVDVAGNLSLGGASNITGNGNIDVAGSFTWNGASIGSISSTGTVTIAGPTTMTTAGQHIVNNKTLTCNGGLTYASGTFSIDNSGVVNVPAGQTFLASLTGGSITANGGSGGTLNIDGTFEKSGGGTLIVYPVLNNVPVFNLNSGNLAIRGGSTHTGAFNIASGASLEIANGTHSFSGCSFMGGGTVSRTGTGSIGSFTGNTIAPGSSPGTFSFSGFTLPMSGNTYALEIGGLTPGTEHDQIPVSGAVTLGGTLNISFLNGFEPHYGDVFVIMTCTTCSGSFSSINYSGLPANAFDVDLTVPGQVRLVGAFALPVELVDFQVFAEGKKTELLWRSANEVNLSHYEIERSPDGRAWQYLGEMPARNSTAETPYFFTDTAPLPLDNYYRLRMLDVDGSFEFSPIKVLHFEAAKLDVQIAPNPTDGRFMLTIHSPFPSDVMVSVSDGQGRELRREMVLQATEHQLNMDMDGLPPGIYSLKVSGQVGFASQRIVKR